MKGIVDIDFGMVVKANGFVSDIIKYGALAKEAEQVIDMLDDMDTDIQLVTFEFTVKMTQEQVSRLTRLLRKGRAHVYYHGGRVPEPGSRLDEFCTVSPDGDKMVVVFNDIVCIQNQKIRGTTIMANLFRLANAMAWVLCHDVKLSDKPVTLRTWDSITVSVENPWKKDDKA